MTNGIKASWSDYYPFGLTKDSRSNQSSSYRFSFNGKEKDSWATDGNIYDYGFRIYNPQYAKFLSVDPLFKSYPWLTPYQFAQNDPIRNIDIDGLEGGSMVESSFNFFTLGTLSDLLPNKPAPPVRNDPSKSEIKISTYEDLIGLIQTSKIDLNSYLKSKFRKDLSDDVPFISQYSLKNGKVACCRASQKILKKHGLKNPGSILNRYIVAKNNSDNTALIILPTAEEAVNHIDEQLSNNNPIMVGVNYNLKKGQDDGQSADHFVVIYGRDIDDNGVFYKFMEVGTRNESNGKSNDNKLRLNSDFSLTGKNYANEKKYTVTDVRKNETKK